MLVPTHFGQTDFTNEAVDAFVEVALRDALTMLRDQVARDLLCAQDDQLNATEARTQATAIVRQFACSIANCSRPCRQ